MKINYYNEYLPICYEYMDADWLPYLLTCSYRKNQLISIPNRLSHRKCIDQLWNQRHIFQTKLNSKLINNFTRKKYLLPRSIAFIDYDHSRQNHLASPNTQNRPHIHEIIFVHQKTVESFLNLSENGFSAARSLLQEPKLFHVHLAKREPIDRYDMPTVLSYCTKFINGPTAAFFGDDADLYDLIAFPTSDRKHRRQSDHEILSRQNARSFSHELII